jgi:hypothetical protein
VNVTLAKALLALVPTSMLIAGSGSMFFRGKTRSSFVQLIGASGLIVVALAHICEALHLLPWMGWGLENSAGHYLNLASALIGITLFPVGYLAFALSKRAP